MKKVLLFVAVVATIALSSCTNKQAAIEKTRQDSLAEVARLDSIAKVEADSLAAIAAAQDTLVIEEVAVEVN